MNKMVKITSKRQITIPVQMFRQLDLEEGDHLVVKIEDNKLTMESSQAILDEIANSVPIPVKFKDMDIDQIIEKAKEEHFSNHHE